ncbi:hypothetical protein RSSM_04725 [Rhodopirellula sallentina SM41]|uniref:Uncharacterized protein n=1 Tax=Rhodopirellula sallentina SM41 TaxID=1263870 RepID=M5U7I4_9BACT|nr:hypothetical protein RSSM_04725 [Rhodopirellula sallentina SM41]
MHDGNSAFSLNKDASSTANYLKPQPISRRAFAPVDPFKPRRMPIV